MLNFLNLDGNPWKNLTLFSLLKNMEYNLGEGPKWMLIICLDESEEREYCVIRLASLKASILVMTVWGII